MRLLEIVLLLGTAILLVSWAARLRVGRWLPPVLAAIAVLHLVLEGQRMAMWPVYAVIAVALLTSVIRREPRPPRRGGWRSAVRVVAAAVLFVVVIPLPWLWPVMRLPTPTGPHAVGQAWLVVVDSSRAERFAREPGAIRRFPVKIWYPTAPDAAGPRASYADPRELAAAGLPVVLFAHTPLITTHAIVGAPVADGERLPVLVFSHGYGGNFGQNTVQMEELASQGYVVASIAHPGEAAWAPFPDGSGMAMDSGIVATMRRQAADPDAMEKALAVLARLDSVRTPEEGIAELRRFLSDADEPIRSESVVEWAADTRALVDLLFALDHGAAASPFHGRLDLRRLGVFGMSYGGATAGEFCRLDDRCRAAINIDGGQYGGLIDDSLSVPLLIMGSSQVFSVHAPVLELTRGPAFLIKVPETTHIGLTDLSLFAPQVFRWAGITGKLDPDRRVQIMNAYVVGFFDTFLRGRSSSLFDEGSTAFPEVTMLRSRHTVVGSR